MPLTNLFLYDDLMKKTAVGAANGNDGVDANREQAPKDLTSAQLHDVYQKSVNSARKKSARMVGREQGEDEENKEP